MAYFRCGNGGGASGIKLDKTLLGTGRNSSDPVTITLGQDYHDFDFLMFEYIYILQIVNIISIFSLRLKWWTNHLLMDITTI
jgi:hypothetical protein